MSIIIIIIIIIIIVLDLFITHAPAHTRIYLEKLF